MERCVKCKSTIEDGTDYVDIVVWDMKDGEGSEVGEATICNSCHTKLIEFLSN